MVGREVTHLHNCQGKTNNVFALNDIEKCPTQVMVTLGFASIDIDLLGL